MLANMKLTFDDRWMLFAGGITEGLSDCLSIVGIRTHGRRYTYVSV